MLRLGLRSLLRPALARSSRLRHRSTLSPLTTAYVSQHGASTSPSFSFSLQRRSFAAATHEDSDFDFEIPEEKTATKDTRTAAVESESEDEDAQEAEVNMLRYQRALEMQQTADQLLKADNFDIAASTYLACIGQLSQFIEFKCGLDDTLDLDVEMHKEVLSPTLGMAFALQQLGRTNEAEKAYEKALQLLGAANVEADAEVTARCALNYADLLCLKGEYQKALAKIKKAKADLSPKSDLYASALCNMAVYNAILKEYDVAVPLAKEGFEAFCALFGKNNAYSQRALETYVRLVRESGKSEEADQLRAEWESTRADAELSEVDAIPNEVIEEMEASLKHLSHKKTFDPHGLIVPPAVLERQKEMFSKQYPAADIGDTEALKLIDGEVAGLYEIVGRAKDFHADMEKFQERLAEANSTTQVPIVNPGFTEYRDEKRDLVDEVRA